MASDTRTPDSWISSLEQNEASYFMALAHYISSKSLPAPVYKRFQELSKNNNESFTLLHLARACYEIMSLFDVLKLIANQMYCFHTKKEHVINIVAVISQSKSNPEGMIVLEGVMPEYSGSFAIKWYKGDLYTIEHEMRMYSKIGEIDKKVLPWFSLSYRLWKNPVLVMRTKKTLDASDHECDVGISILKKLAIIHNVCIHCDIKRDNIVKDDEDYYLIDFGQSTLLDDKGHLYHSRYVHTSSYMRSGFKDKTSIKTDLIELCHALRSIQMERLKQKGPYTSGFKGSLKTFHKAVMNLDEYPDRDCYDKLAGYLVKK